MSEGQINIRCLSNLGRFPKWLYVILAAGTHIFLEKTYPSFVVLTLPVASAVSKNYYLGLSESRLTLRARWF